MPQKPEERNMTVKDDKYDAAVLLFACVILLALFALTDSCREPVNTGCTEFEVYSGLFVPCCVLREYDSEVYCELPNGNVLWLDKRGDGMG